MSIPKLRDWSIRRSGDRLRVIGIDEAGQERKLKGVFEVRETHGGPGYFAIGDGGGRIAELLGS